MRTTIGILPLPWGYNTRQLEMNIATAVFFYIGEKPMDNLTPREIVDNFLPRDVFEEHKKRVDAEHERQNARISQLEKAMEDIKKITVSVERLAISMENMTRELERQGKRLDEIEDTPRDRWNTAVKAGITTLVGTIIGALITGIVMFMK